MRPENKEQTIARLVASSHANNPRPGALVHELKTLYSFFYDVRSGTKNFEVRKNDRNFQVGDFLLLRCHDSNGEPIRTEPCMCLVTYLLPGGQFGIEEGYCVMGIKVLT